MTDVTHLEEPAHRLVIAADMLEELVREIGEAHHDDPVPSARAWYMATSLKGDLAYFFDLLQIAIRESKLPQPTSARIRRVA
jgi:hypothetical protein